MTGGHLFCYSLFFDRGGRINREQKKKTVINGSKEQDKKKKKKKQAANRQQVPVIVPRLDEDWLTYGSKERRQA